MITGILEIQGQVRGVLAEHSAGAVSVFGAWIRLPEERWQHIVREHPELEGLHQEVLVTVEAPLRFYQEAMENCWPSGR